MTLSDLSQGSVGNLRVSFEFFPPATEAMEKTLWRSVDRLAPLSPSFVSVTYGAGGSTRERTHSIVRRLRQESDLEPAAHLTCVGATKEEIHDVVDDYWESGIKHIVALRGDAPQGAERYEAHPGGYENAAALVEGLRKRHDFELSVAAYPECHPDSPDRIVDIDNLKRKIDAGATRAITQYCFDTHVFEEFLNAVRKAGITAPIVPGILPVTNFKQAVNFSKRAGASVPDWMFKLYEGLDDDVETRRLVAATQVAEQVRQLKSLGIRDFHFYTLNRFDLSYAICHLLGMRPTGDNPGFSAGFDD